MQVAVSAAITQVTVSVEVMQVTVIVEVTQVAVSVALMQLAVSVAVMLVAVSVIFLIIQCCYLCRNKTIDWCLHNGSTVLKYVYGITENKHFQNNVSALRKFKL